MQHAPEEFLEIHLLFFFQNVTWEKAKSLGQDRNKGNVLESDLAFCAELRTVSKLGKSLAAFLPGHCTSFTGLDCRDWPSIFLARSCPPSLISNLQNHKESHPQSSTLLSNLPAVRVVHSWLRTNYIHWFGRASACESLQGCCEHLHV